jgi:hypothetical protein
VKERVVPQGVRPPIFDRRKLTPRIQLPAVMSFPIPPMTNGPR